MAGIGAVIFDIGNVLIEWEPEKYYDQTIGAERRKALFSQVDLHGMNERVDLGEGFKDIIFETADAYPEWRAEIQDWHNNWLQLIGPQIEHSLRLLRALRQVNVPVFALSNFGVESYDLAKANFPILHEFDREYISGHLKMTKPNPAIYEYVEGDCGIAPENLLFADDRADNIAAAQARGWQAHLFTSAQGWADCLVAQGVLNGDQAK